MSMLRCALPKIVRTPDTCGGKSRIDGTRIPVWIIAARRNMGSTVNDIIFSYPHLTPESVEVAFKYIDENKEEINQDMNREL